MTLVFDYEWVRRGINCPHRTSRLSSRERRNCFLRWIRSLSTIRLSWKICLSCWIYERTHRWTEPRTTSSTLTLQRTNMSYEQVDDDIVQMYLLLITWIEFVCVIKRQGMSYVGSFVCFIVTGAIEPSVDVMVSHSSPLSSAFPWLSHLSIAG